MNLVQVTMNTYILEIQKIKLQLTNIYFVHNTSYRDQADGKGMVLERK